MVESASGVPEGGGLSPGVPEGGGVAPGVQEEGGFSQGVQEAGLGALPRGQELVAAGGGGPGRGGGQGRWHWVPLGERTGLQEWGERPALVTAAGGGPKPGAEPRRPRERGTARARRRARGAEEAAAGEEGGSPGVQPPRRARCAVRGVQEHGPKAGQEQGLSRRAQQERGGGRREASPPGRTRWWVRRGRQEEGEARGGVQEEGEFYSGEQEHPGGTPGTRNPAHRPSRRRAARTGLLPASICAPRPDRRAAASCLACGLPGERPCLSSACGDAVDPAQDAVAVAVSTEPLLQAGAQCGRLGSGYGAELWEPRDGSEGEPGTPASTATTTTGVTRPLCRPPRNSCLPEPGEQAASGTSTEGAKAPTGRQAGECVTTIWGRPRGPARAEPAPGAAAAALLPPQPVRSLPGDRAGRKVTELAGRWQAVVAASGVMCWSIAVAGQAGEGLGTAGAGGKVSRHVRQSQPWRASAVTPAALHGGGSLLPRRGPGPARLGCTAELTALVPSGVPSHPPSLPRIPGC
ncbi:spidroin-2-like [Neopsephotus bourkii]|uniref:spidroin-2-like n=1 Tax=Neopsephotus bourkii TaxID=309878 RepID=UPI002AA50CA5|nr:spidroin-2-like [Neopsephotus bourkii]